MSCSISLTTTHVINKLRQTPPNAHSVCLTDMTEWPTVCGLQLPLLVEARQVNSRDKILGGGNRRSMVISWSTLPSAAGCWTRGRLISFSLSDSRSTQFGELVTFFFGWMRVISRRCLLEQWSPASERSSFWKSWQKPHFQKHLYTKSNILLQYQIVKKTYNKRKLFFFMFGP